MRFSGSGHRPPASLGAGTLAGCASPAALSVFDLAADLVDVGSILSQDKASGFVRIREIRRTYRVQPWQRIGSHVRLGTW